MKKTKTNPNVGLSSAASAVNARESFNEFMKDVVTEKAISVEHVRIRSRQPVSEAFVRKAVFAANRFEAATSLDVKVSEFKEFALSGPAALGEAAALVMKGSYTNVARYLGNPREAIPAEPRNVDAEMTRSDLFCLLSAYSAYEIAKRSNSALPIASGAITIAAGFGGIQVERTEVKAAADSVYEQSFCDVHAISLIAAFDGKKVALDTLTEVMATREAGGDFGRFSLAPLSHDTKSAMSILAVELRSKSDFAKMTRNEIWDNSRWIAAEGVSAWMQSNGVDFKDVNRLSQSLDVVNKAAFIQEASLTKTQSAANSPGSTRRIIP
jgi:hypothetical protein